MEPNNIKLIATAFIFSGRKDPEWMLNKKQAAQWMKLWQQASLSDKEAVLPSVLGYRGCKLKENELSYWQLFNGLVSHYSKEGVISKEDTGKQMETFLMNTAPAEVMEILKMLKAL